MTQTKQSFFRGFGRIGRWLGVYFSILAIQSGAGGIETSRDSGFISTPFALTLNAGDGTSVYYTTNGTAPLPSTGSRYLAPIQVTSTTVLRAQAFQGNAPSGGLVTRTYLFPCDILRQNGAGLPTNWDSKTDSPMPAYYQLRVSGDSSAISQQIVDGLKSIPSLSIVGDPGDLFSSDTGIYHHPEERGALWERPVSIEWLPADGTRGFASPCGIRIHGGTSRDPEQSPKHSFRLNFRKRYGRASLDYPLFDTHTPQRVTTLILRAGHNNTWLHPDAAQRSRADYLRDEWMRRSLGDMGYPSERGTFAHVYLNGIYWGLYNLCEEPGTTTPTDSQKGDAVKSGDQTIWNQILTLANAGLSDRQRYDEFQKLLDLQEFTDYMILNLYAGTKDWDRHSNWYAVRPREPGARYRFYIWDAERTLEDVDVATLDFEDKESPPGLFHALLENAGYRTFFESQVRKLFAGPLSADANAHRYRLLVGNVEKAMLAEAARWGSYRHDVHPYRSGPFEIYTVQNHWLREVDRILNEYFPRRTQVVLEQLAQSGLYGRAGFQPAPSQ